MSSTIAVFGVRVGKYAFLGVHTSDKARWRGKTTPETQHFVIGSVSKQGKVYRW